MHLPTSARSIPVRTESRISTCCTEAGAIWRMWVQTSRRYIEFQFFYSIERRAIWVLKFKLLNKNSKLKLKIKIRMGTRFPRGWRRNSSTSWRPWPKASLCQAMRSKSWRSSMTERATSQGYHLLELNIIHRKRILTSIFVKISIVKSELFCWCCRTHSSDVCTRWELNGPSRTNPQEVLQISIRMRPASRRWKICCVGGWSSRPSSSPGMRTWSRYNFQNYNRRFSNQKVAPNQTTISHFRL